MDEQEMRNRGARVAVLFAAIGFALAALAFGRALDFAHWKDFAFQLLAAAFALFTTAAGLGYWAGARVQRGGGLMPCLLVAVASMVATVVAGGLISLLVFPSHGDAGAAVQAYLVAPVEAVLINGTVPALVLGTIYFIVLRALSRRSAAAPAKPSPGKAAQR